MLPLNYPAEPTNERDKMTYLETLEKAKQRGWQLYATSLRGVIFYSVLRENDEGTRVSVNPTTGEIVNGKLFTIQLKNGTTIELLIDGDNAKLL
jgi:hypothetical protein